jgi:tRNA-Thr(GGU) m(6)t(6)A37 methyltransferase TsaA
MSEATTYGLVPIGWVRSSLKRRADAPKQGDEGAPDARIQIEAPFTPALDRLAPGDDLLIFTWLHEGKRDVLAVHPRGDLSKPLHGVFATRSPDRPNPIGLHPVRLLAIESGGVLHVSPLEAIDGTPVVDIKPALAPGKGR